MKRVIHICFVLILLPDGAGLQARKSEGEQGKSTGAKKEAPARKLITAYLGQSGLSGGNISKHDFDNFLKQGITAKDSLGTAYKVDGFTFSYSERNLYEDSVGNLMVLTDYLSEFCPGDTVSPAVANNIYYKTKPGDTAYFENIRATHPDGWRIGAKGMRFILTK